MADAPIEDSDNYISKSAYELIDYLYFHWGIYKDANKPVIADGYRMLTSMKDDLARPCDDCYRKRICKRDGYECKQFKAWSRFGK